MKGTAPRDAVLGSSPLQSSGLHSSLHVDGWVRSEEHSEVQTFHVAHLGGTLTLRDRVQSCCECWKHLCTGMA